jgi:hypothetical protein
MNTWLDSLIWVVNEPCHSRRHAKHLNFTQDDFVALGLREDDFRWYARAVPLLGEEAALKAIADGHQDYLLVGNIRRA